jgi:hypothetical protein
VTAQAIREKDICSLGRIIVSKIIGHNDVQKTQVFIRNLCFKRGIAKMCKKIKPAKQMMGISLKI